MQNNYIKEEIQKQLKLWLNSFFATVNYDVVKESADEAYLRCMESISALNNKYLRTDDGTPQFSVYHTGCQALYLYFLANILGRKNIRREAEQIYYLNKILHSVDWYYEISLPPHFMVEHPLGSVLGRAEYGDYLYIYQGVTVGGNISLNTSRTIYPVLGNNVLLYANAKVLGDSHIGDNVILSANTYVINETIPDNSIVFGTSPDLVIRHDPDAIRVTTEMNWSTKIM